MKYIEVINNSEYQILNKLIMSQGFEHNSLIDLLKNIASECVMKLSDHIFSSYKIISINFSMKKKTLSKMANKMFTPTISDKFINEIRIPLNVKNKI